MPTEGLVNSNADIAQPGINPGLLLKARKTDERISELCKAFFVCRNEKEKILVAILTGIIIEKEENELIFAGYGYRAYLKTTNAGKQLDFFPLNI